MTAARLCAVLLLAVGLLNGCRSEQPAPAPTEPTFANWPQPLDDFRFRWSAEPAIDLLTGPAVPLRAYLESHRIGDFALDADTVYPGFHRAVPSGPPNTESFPDEPFQLWYIQPFDDPRYGFGPAGTFYGNEYFHVLELATMDGGGYRAYVCDGLYNVFREGSTPGKYVSIGAPEESDSDPDKDSVQLWRIEFTDHPQPSVANAPAMVAAPQKGPNPAPLGDVFGPWRFTGANQRGEWGPPGPANPESLPTQAFKNRLQQCRDKMPHDAAQRRGFYSNETDQPPTAEPADPGWPDNAA